LHYGKKESLTSKEKLLIKLEKEDEESKSRRKGKGRGTNITPLKIYFRRYISIGMEDNEQSVPHY
jgi:hypothetical protein